ncbi:hypothetical protein J7K97_00585 [Candidatus Aerophobetes bacterium]|nr:hypothetical protein [Candidatus Aerophobetes bacterium]
MTSKIHNSRPDPPCVCAKLDYSRGADIKLLWIQINLTIHGVLDVRKGNREASDRHPVYKRLVSELDSDAPINIRILASGSA